MFAKAPQKDADMLENNEQQIGLLGLDVARFE